MLVLALAGLAGCDRVRPRERGVDVYVAGWESDGNVTIAKLWKNGVAQSLGEATSANGVAVSGNDVLVVGCVRDPSTTATVATLWRNGVPQALTDGTRSACAEGVAASGSDVYVVGYEGPAVMLWKNGGGEILASGCDLHCAAYDVAVSGGDVYVAGFVSEPNGPVAKLWKNGGAIPLSAGFGSAARGVALDGADVYAVGEVVSACSAPCVFQSTAVVWRNGAPTAWTDGSLRAMATSVAVAGGAVYAAGIQFNGTVDVPVVWADGARTSLGSGAQAGGGNAIAVAGSDVYVAGYDGPGALYWKNGAPVRLSAPGVDGRATSIAVVAR